MITKILQSFFLLVFLAVVRLMTTMEFSGFLSQAAGGQLRSGTDATAMRVVAYGSMAGTIFSAFLTLFGIYVLYRIWRTDLEKLWKHMIAPALAIAFLAASPLHTPVAEAYFDKVDKTEIVPVLPNQSAFWIPDEAPASTQTQTDSESFLQANKVQIRSFQVPHKRLAGSAGNSIFSGWDYYVPSGRLIIVDRTPFSREWVDAEDRGTSKKKEGFPCQTNEGLNVIAGVAIGAAVKEADAARFLYNYGTRTETAKLTGQPETDGPVIFRTVYYGRSLAEVMDDDGRKLVQTLVCDQLATRTLDEANSSMKAMMDEIRKQATAYMKNMGITLNFIGWGDTLEFDKPVQAAINRRYEAKIDTANAALLAPHAETLKALALAQLIRQFGEKTDGRLPTTLMAPLDFLGMALKGPTLK